ncbi:MAG: flagellar basal body-associated protein FliL [Sulfuricella sp.]|jgi:flagellar FliL protein|nr:flagellar basal body-associated protein FliL [Sulfuricella sp.]
MAKDKGKPAAEAAEAAPRKGKGKLLIIIVAAVVLLGGGGGAAWYFLHGKKEGGEATAKHEDPAKPPVFVKLEAFTVNLTADGEDHYLQTDIELKVSDAKVSDQVKEHMPEIRNNVLLLLSSKTAGALSTMEGKQKLSDEIKEQVNKVLHVKDADGVSGVFFTSFVIQ